jgi:hypothetical protein
MLGNVAVHVNLLDQRVLDSGSGPGHALSTGGDLFPNRMEGFEGLRPEAS